MSNFDLAKKYRSHFSSSHTPTSVKEPFPWFRDKCKPSKSTLKFSCVQCGKCCKGRSRNKVFLNEAEIVDISTYLGIDSDEFLSKYTYTVENPNDRSQRMHQVDLTDQSI